MMRWITTPEPSVKHLFAGIAAADFQSTLALYERLLGRAPDMHPQAGEARGAGFELASSRSQTGG